MEQLPQPLSQLESLLFIAHTQLSFEKIAHLLHLNASEVENMVPILQKEYESGNRGIRIICTDQAA